MARPYTLKPRGKTGILWVRFTAPGGQPVFRSTGTPEKALATEYASKLHAEHYRVARLGEKPRRLWQEAVARWLSEHQHKRSLGKDEHNIEWLDPFLGRKYLDEIDADLLALIVAARKAEPRDKRRKGADGPRTSQATADKMLALIRSILRAASSWGWLDRLPTIRLASTATEDYRWLTREEAATLRAELADHLRPPFDFALATGLREQNVMRLEWDKVDLGRATVRVQGAKAKGKQAFGLPLNRDALRILKGQAGKHGKWVFPNEAGKPYHRANNHGFKRAQERAGIAPLRWHDLRHTWASWHVMAGTPLRSLMELGGWRSYSSVLRYAHLSPEHLATDAARIESPVRNLHRKAAAKPRKPAVFGYRADKAKPRKAAK